MGGIELRARKQESRPNSLLKNTHIYPCAKLKEKYF
jgi:hypothetical protein